MSMDLEYEWMRYGSLRKGGQLSYALKITCKRWWKTEKVAYTIVDGSGQLPPQQGYIELKAGQSRVIDYDHTPGEWDWCEGDFIIIYDTQGREYDRKVFSLTTYGPGECPECHGSHQCAACHGTGRITDKMHMVSTCPRCLGTGVCQTCYVPTRNGGMTANMATFGSSVATNTNPKVEMSRQQRMIALRKRIAELEAMISRCEFDERTRMTRDANFGYDTSRTTDYMRQAQLKNTYQTQLIQLRYELEQLESGGF